MKFTCTRKEILEALQIVGKAVAYKPQNPILSGIYLKADNEMLDMQATDYELGLTAKIPVAVEEPGEALLMGRYLQEVVRRLPGEQVVFTLNKEEKILHITSDKAKFTLLSMDPKEFPTIQHFDGTLEFTIKNIAFANTIKKTVFSCSTDETRPVFTGCYLEVAEDNLIMAATNTHRLAVKTDFLDKDCGSIKIIIPSKALNEILHIISTDKPGDVRVICSANKLSIFFENIYLTTRLIEGSYPDYNKVVPASFATTVTLNIEELTQAVDRVSLISRVSEYNVIRLSFTEGNLHISSNNPEIGNAEEDVTARLEGPEVNIAFNAKYITDVLKVMDAEECTISLNQSLNPIAIRDGDDKTFIYVVTPVRTTH
ncbi:MAG: DNA polymerase III subunit beta [Selenomonadaceae bacterium]|nr:DNA polymerase III subunit beta [Selenomonadaceae bacterium]